MVETRPSGPKLMGPKRRRNGDLRENHSTPLLSRQQDQGPPRRPPPAMNTQAQHSVRHDGGTRGSSPDSCTVRLISSWGPAHRHRPGTGDSRKRACGPRPPCVHWSAPSTTAEANPSPSRRHCSDFSRRHRGPPKGPSPPSRVETREVVRLPHVPASTPSWGAGAPCTSACRAGPYFLSSLPPWGGGVHSDLRPRAGLRHLPLPKL